MEFRTAIRTPENLGIMHHSDVMTMLGSCFTENIGAKLRGAMMNVEINPFGTIYNPLSMASCVQRLVDAVPERGMDLFQGGGVWNSFNFHSRYSLPDKAATLERMNERIVQGHDHLQRSNTLVVTLGTAIVYRLAATGEVVNNCHKVPQHKFTREMASVDEVTDALKGMVEQLHAFNPGLYILFTVSPIRHIADGLELNSLSKAVLRVAIDKVMKQYPDFTGYFPSFEIMMDDLRDYRFYSTDMVHPSEVAVEYIWQAFRATYFDDPSIQAIARCERVMKRLQHRPMSGNRDVVSRFHDDTVAVVRNLVNEYPYIAEVNEIKNMLSDS